MVLRYAKKMALDISNPRQKQFLIYLTGTEIAGFLRIRSVEINELATLGVRKKFRSKGISSTMIEYVKQQKKSLFLVMVIPKYFKKLGFITVTEIPNSLVDKVQNKRLWEGFGQPVVMNWHK
jgi:N-acetylglutamate synthase-like GNAT family acetyltransferase